MKYWGSNIKDSTLFSYLLNLFKQIHILYTTWLGLHILMKSTKSVTFIKYFTPGLLCSFVTFIQTILLEN